MDTRKVARSVAPLALLVVVACASAAAGQQQEQQPAQEWKRVEPAGEDYSVLMPPDPEHTADELPIMGNKYRLSMYMTMGPDGVIYGMATQELPTIVANLAPRDKLESFVGGFKEGLAGLAGGAGSAGVTLTPRTDLTLKGRAGREYGFAAAETRGLVRVYDGGRRVYVLMIFGAAEPTPAVRRFFDSFDIKAEQPAPRTTANQPAAIQADPVLVPPDDRPLPYGDPKGASGAGHASGGGPAHTTPVDYTRPFTAGEVTRKAVLLSKPEPGSTEEARRNKVTGVVKVRVLLGADGKVSKVSVIEGLPDGLTEAAVAAARKIEFRPAQKDGRAVSQWVTVDYYFN